MDTPFDRRLRRLRRDRAMTLGGASYLYSHAASELIGRLGDVKREFREALLLGYAGSDLVTALETKNVRAISAGAGAADVVCDEDRLPFADRSFDLVISVGVLDSVNDLPGALRLIRRCLRPDGLFLAAFVGAGSFPRLRSAMQAADAAASGGIAPRIHPQIDVRAAGDLLVRAGFALPVADIESLDVRLATFAALIADLRAMATTNILCERERIPLTRRALAAASADFGAYAETDGKITERIEIVYLTGWAPTLGKPG